MDAVQTISIVFPYILPQQYWMRFVYDEREIFRLICTKLDHTKPTVFLYQLCFILRVRGRYLEHYSYSTFICCLTTICAY